RRVNATAVSAEVVAFFAVLPLTVDARLRDVAGTLRGVGRTALVRAAAFAAHRAHAALGRSTRVLATLRAAHAVRAAHAIRAAASGGGAAGPGLDFPRRAGVLAAGPGFDPWRPSAAARWFTCFAMSGFAARAASARARGAFGRFGDSEQVLAAVRQR